MRILEYIPAQDLLKEVNLVDDIKGKVDLCKEIIHSINDTFIKDWEATFVTFLCFPSGHLNETIVEFKNKKPKKNRSESVIIRDDKLYQQFFDESEEARLIWSIHILVLEVKGSVADEGEDAYIIKNYNPLELEELLALKTTEDRVTMRAEKAVTDFFYLLKLYENDTYNNLLDIYQRKVNTNEVMERLSGPIITLFAIALFCLLLWLFSFLDKIL
jgi:hypothetical protein